jgi:hypothetical protein
LEHAAAARKDLEIRGLFPEMTKLLLLDVENLYRGWTKYGLGRTDMECTEAFGWGDSDQQLPSIQDLSYDKGSDRKSLTVYE